MKHLRWIWSLPFLLLAFQNCSQGPVSKTLVPFDLPRLKTEPRNFTSCDEFQSWKDKRVRQYSSVWSESWDSSSLLSSAAPVALSSSITNIQEAGVDEPDILKSDDNHLFVARSASVEMVNKFVLTIDQSLPLPELRNIKLFVHMDKLVVFGEQREGAASTSKYVMKTYLKKGNALTPLKSRVFSGRFVSARLSAGQVVLVLQNSGALASTPEVGGSFKDVPCEHIQYPVLDDFNFDLTTVHKIALDGNSIQSLGLPGRSDQIYMSDSALYLLGNGYSWFHFDPRLNSDVLWQSQVITKIDVSSTNLRYLAAGMVFGHIRDVWAMKELNQGFYMATTYSRKGVNQNRLWNLKQTGTRLEVAGQSPEFGAREDIRSVRYINNKAYVVTFERTDPLFTFDLSAGGDPLLLSRLEVPGFSAYLHPLDNQLILGVGYAAEVQQGFSLMGGLQLSLFDIRNPSNVTALHQLEFGGRYSRADVTTDHHAFYYGDGIVALPVTIVKKTAPGTQFWESSGEIEFSGAMLLAMNNQVKVVAKVSHSEWIPAQCRQQSGGFGWNSERPSMDIRRITKVGRRLLTVSPFGVKDVVPSLSFATVLSVPFSGAEAECEHLRRGQYYLASF